MSVTGFAFFRFVAVLFLIYYIVPKKFQWPLLLLGSGFFYYFCGLNSCLLLAGAVLLSWGTGLLLEKIKHKGILLAGISLIFLCWLVFMRLPFRIPLKSVLIPAGLSFFGLQCIGYCVEVYRGNAAAERNPLRYALYISFFPHVLQGPFADYNNLKKQLDAPHDFDYERTVQALFRIAYGLMKKLVIADRLNIVLATPFYTGEGYYGATVLLILILYALQLYADFSGYMDIALGVARLFGIELTENFDVPYASKSMAEFWRRWHRSLGLYFRSYVFFPILRSRPCTALQKHFKKKGNKYLMKVLPLTIALAVNWTLIGIWHGLRPTYMVYDWFCGAFIILAEVLKPLYDRINNSAPKFFKSRFMDGVRVVRTFLLVAFSFVFFRPETLETSFTLIRNLFSAPGVWEAAQFIYMNILDLFLLIVPVLVMGITDICRYRNINICEKLHRLPLPLRWLIYICGVLLIVISRGDRGEVGFAYAVF
ncbi:MAG: MBOAT family protein [Lachnospiraceae bacterium]|nr:MBOAT family protein [Lachnospiraceae bacterium]